MLIILFQVLFKILASNVVKFRCVEPRDKNFAMGIVGSFLAVFSKTKSTFD